MTRPWDPDAAPHREAFLEAAKAGRIARRRGRPVREGADDHFYGSWGGGGKSAGGRPSSGGGGRQSQNAAGTAPGSKPSAGGWKDHDALIADMEQKYPGSSWSEMRKVDLALAVPVTQEIDAVVSRFGTEGWHFAGVRAPSSGGAGVLAEVKHVPGGTGSAVFLPRNYWGKESTMAAEAKSALANPKWSTASQVAHLGTTAYARSIVAHEMGHEYLGLNLHLRIGANRDAAVRKEVEPWFHGTFLPNLKTHHVSQYGRKNAHEAWAELFAGALGHAKPVDEAGYVKTLKGMLDKHYPPASIAEALAWTDLAGRPLWLALREADAFMEGPAGYRCAWSRRHPEADSVTRPS